MSVLQKSFCRWIQNTRGEQLGEVIIAMVVFSVVATAATKLLVTTIAGNDLTQERLIAFQLAREGTELVQELRDSNWLRFPGNREECWDTLDAPNAGSCDTSTTLIDGTSYIITKNVAESDEAFAMEWTPNPSPGDQRLFEFTIGGKTFWTHNVGANMALTGIPTPYYRRVTIQKEQTRTPEDTLVVESLVTWESRAQSRSVLFYSTLFNYPES